MSQIMSTVKKRRKRMAKVRGQRRRRERMEWESSLQNPRKLPHLQR